MAKINQQLPWSEQYRIAAKNWVKADAAASLLEETKSSVLSQMMLKMGDIPVSHAEKQAKASYQWVDFLTKMVNAREDANLLRVEKEFLGMRFQEWNSAQANRRAEMKL